MVCITLSIIVINAGVHVLQWNPSTMATIGNKGVGHYRGVATDQGFISTIKFICIGDQGECPL